MSYSFSHWALSWLPGAHALELAETPSQTGLAKTSQVLEDPKRAGKKGFRTDLSSSSKKGTPFEFSTSGTALGPCVEVDVKQNYSPKHLMISDES